MTDEYYFDMWDKIYYLSKLSEDGEEWCMYNKDPRVGINTIAVSNYARAYSFVDNHFLKDYGENQPYMYWYFNPYDEEAVRCPIHQAVAELFCIKPKITDRLVIDHIDGDKHNNLASNLRWVTYKENSNAQDVQKRKAESLKKTTQHRKEIESLTKIIQEKDEEIQYWKKKYYGSAADILALKAYYNKSNNRLSHE